MERGQESAAESKLLSPEQAASEEEKRQIFALALGAAVITCCGPPQLQPGTGIRKQASGGLIGLKLSGAVAFHGLVVLQLQRQRWCSGASSPRLERS